MKQYSFLLTVLVAVICVLFTASCSSHSDELLNSDAQQDGVHTYNLHLNAGVLDFEGAQSRATTSNWTYGSVLYFRFGSVTGKATYNGSTWIFTTNSTLSNTSSAASCTAVYVENPVSMGSSSITLSMNSAVYKGTGTYTCSSGDIYVNINLSPATARMRFKGSYGTQIELPSDKNDIYYPSSISLSTLTLTSAKSNVGLTVGSTGYTPYIYGNLANTSGSNTIYVKNVSESNEYQLMSFSGTKLPVGSSGYLTVPTSSNYSGLGWSKIGGSQVDNNSYVRPNLLVPFTDGMCTNWTVGNTAKTVYMMMFRDLSSYASDEDIIEMVISGTARDAQEQAGYITLWSGDWYYSNTTYYLCTISYNSQGVRGPLQKYTFRTNSTSLPIATLSNLTPSYDSSDNMVWSFNLSMSYGATKFYFLSSESEGDYNSNEHFMAYNLYRDIKNGQITDLYDLTGSLITGRSASKGVLLTYAVDSYSNIGNYSCAKYPATSNAKADSYKTTELLKSNKNSQSIDVPESKLNHSVKISVYPFGNN